MKTVMIVDDSRTVREAVKYTLGKENFHVIEAEDGQHGLDVLAEQQRLGKRPAMIISDINMPRMDGITFITKVKKMPGMRFVPILVLTTESQQAMKMQGKEAGAAGWLVKPFQPEQLVQVVRKFVRA
ncbi:MAG: response regulator [Firmicutes bacterium]|jgi:two-component system chemotaxis response regulator CheY|nr:response regulator [Bacillota bacterium]NLN16217.1 response regulator [Bacillota bacterium]